MKLDEKEIEWIRNRLTEFYSSQFTVSDPNFQKRAIERRTQSMVRAIEEDSPTNIREYVEKQLTEKELDQKLSAIERHIWNLAPSQTEKQERYEKELNQFLEEADKKIQGYSNIRGRQISEIRGDLIGLRTNGKRGSTRMVQRIVFAQIAKEQLKKGRKRRGLSIRGPS